MHVLSVSCETCLRLGKLGYLYYWFPIVKHITKVNYIFAPRGIVISESLFNTWLMYLSSLCDGEGMALITGLIECPFLFVLMSGWFENRSFGFSVK